jgi:polysaccharide export outer membrane protein
MRKILSLFVITILGYSLGYGQLSAQQEEMLKKYMREQKPQNAVDAVEKYSSPELYERPEDSIVTPAAAAPSGIRPDSIRQPAVAEDTIPVEQSLQVFGHDIFKDAGMDFPPNLFTLPPADYTLGPGDNIIIYLWGRVNQEFDLTVDRAGKVFVPKVGDIVAVGCTLEQFKSNVNSNLNTIYSDYEISVSLGKLREIRIFIFGEVINPGSYSVSPLATLLHGLYMAHGITETGSLRNIKLIRRNGKEIPCDLYDLLLDGDTDGDIKLLSGDVIFVPVCGPRVSVYGEVKRPAIYELRGTEDIDDLLEMAGGGNPTAYTEKITLDRVGANDGRVLYNIDLKDTTSCANASMKLRDGDIIRIPSIYEFHENKVHLLGNVKHPGTFAVVDSMTVGDLLSYGEQLREKTYMARADLYRLNADGSFSVIPINLGGVIEGNSEVDIRLQPFDSLVVFSQEQIVRKKYVSIEGEVRNPGKYVLYKDMKLSDLIFQAGSLTKQAFLLRAEIARINPGKPVYSLYANLEDILVSRIDESDVILKEDDYVFIRQIPNWRPVPVVKIEGDVYFPGKYPINHENEKLSSLIYRAGGLTPTAFPKGTIFLRKSIEAEVSRRNISQIIENTSESKFDSLGNELLSIKTDLNLSELNRIIIDLPAILDNPNGPEDIQLSDCDYIYIPATPSGVQVIGAVASNGTITYIKDKKGRYYLEQAGGMTPNAAKSEVRLVKANGSVIYGSRALGERIELGDAIVVPTEIKRQRDWGKILTSSATVISSLATTLLLIDRIR